MRKHRRLVLLDDYQQNCSRATSNDRTNDGHQDPSASISDIHLASRKAEESALRRFQATSWLEQMVGPLDLTSLTSEEELRLLLRNGLILCNLVNKVNPGAVQKVVENSAPSIASDGPAQFAYQYFENVRNFVLAVENMKLPSFEASDLEKGGLPDGSLGKVIDCILALKSYHEWKQNGGQGFCRFGGTLKTLCASKSLSQTSFGLSSSENHEFLRPVIKPFAGKTYFDADNHCFSHCYSYPETFSDQQNLEPVVAWLQLLSQNFPETIKSEKTDITEHSILDMPGAGSQINNIQSVSLLNLVATVIRSRPPDEIPFVIEFMLRKVVEEFEQRLSCQGQQLESVLKHLCAQEIPDIPQSKLTEIKVEKNRDDLKRKLEDPYSTRDLQGWQANVDEKRRHLVEIQKDELQGLKNVFTTIRKEIVNMQTQWGREMKTLDVHMQALAHAATGYHKAIAENRDLYNQVQDLKGKIRVYCRVRPLLSGQATGRSPVDFFGENDSLVIVSPFKQSKEHRRMFKFNRVFGPCATQEDVFTDTQPLIRSVLDGYNVCIFAYGQTGSGKTYTMSGPEKASSKDKGVNFRALHDLFTISQSRIDVIKYDVGVQMIEIYNEQLKDLLCTRAGDKKLDIRNNSQQNGLNVPDAVMVSVKSSIDVMDLMDIGHKNRSIGATALNERSSRSHSVLTVHVQGTDVASGTILRGRLHLVDLAGSERVVKSEAVGDRLKETQHINKSLSALGDVIAALASRSTHVPYRNSKLTQLLQDSLGGQAKTLMFVHVSPDEGSYGETMSTLKFAERVATVELGAARSNRERGEIQELKEQISCLKDALTKKDAEIKRLQKDNHAVGLENIPDRARRVSPQSCRMKAETHSQSTYMQAVEETHVQVLKNHISGAAAPEFDLTSDISLEDSFDGSQFQPCSKHCVHVLEEDKCDHRVTKTSCSAERSSIAETYNDVTSSLDRNKHELLKHWDTHWTLPGCNDLRIQNSVHQEKSIENVDNLQPYRCFQATEGLNDGEASLTSRRNQIVHEQSSSSKHEAQLLDSIQACLTEESSAVRAVGDEECSDISESDAWEVQRTYASSKKQESNNNSSAQGSGKLQPGYSRRTHDADATSLRNDSSKMTTSGSLSHLRGISSIGPGIESFASKRHGGMTTAGTKSSTCSDGAVEYYSKAKSTWQSTANSISVPSKSSKRWL